MKKLKVLLAGSTGFIGKVLLFELSQRNFEIYCPVREISSENLYLNKKKITEIEVDITKKESVEVLQRQCGKLDLIISCIGSRTGGHADSKRVEYTANSNLLILGEILAIKQFILLSAICVHRPKLAFQRYKLKFESLLNASQINHTIVRPTAYFKSLAGQVNRVFSDKSFIVFDSGVTNRFKPISERDLSRYIIKQIFNPSCFNKILQIGGPGPAINPLQQGQLLFRLAKKPVKIRSVPSFILRILIIAILPLALFSTKYRDQREFLKIALFYATESMLVWDNEKNIFSDKLTPEFGKDTLEDFYIKIISDKLKTYDLADIKLFS